MPPKKDKKRLVSTDTTDSSEAVDHDDQRLSDVIPTASITDSALGMLRQELLEMKSGIQKRLDVVITNQESLLSRITDMEKKYEDLEKSISFTSETMEEIQAENKLLSSNLNTLTRKLELADRKIVQLEESTLQLERYSRSYNLRFGGIPELDDESPSYPYEKLKEILKEKCNLVPEIENAHWSGRPPKTPSDKPRHILAKFIYRPERQAILQQGKKALAECGIFMIPDLPAADAAKKRSLRDVMSKAYQEGKKPNFRNGQLYIDGRKYIINA